MLPAVGALLLLLHVLLTALVALATTPLLSSTLTLSTPHLACEGLLPPVGVYIPVARGRAVPWAARVHPLCRSYCQALCLC